MSWQKCPICGGTGTMTGEFVSCTSVICPTCKGYRIISEITGLPPEYQQLVEDKFGFLNSFPKEVNIEIKK